jgi:hypothetical protein
LKPGGVLLSVSHGNPDIRIPLFDKSVFDNLKHRVEVTSVGKMLRNFDKHELKRILEKPQVLGSSASGDPGIDGHYVYVVYKDAT